MWVIFMAVSNQSTSIDIVWPSLPLAAWQDTYATLHLWTQVIGKIRLALAPKLNHWWQSTLYVTPRGLTTASIPCGTRNFQISFDFLDHQLQIDTSDGIAKRIALSPRSVADFYQMVLTTLSNIGIEVRIWTMPQEVSEPIPFDQDYQHAAYDPEYAQRFWRILVQVDRVMTLFRSQFIGKSSPVHFFWGSFDLAVTRFSGRRAPEHPGEFRIWQIGSHEKPIHTKSVAVVFGQGVGQLWSLFFTLMLTLRRKGSMITRSNPQKLFTAQRCKSLSYPMKP
jgi:hypothetical protein